MGSREKARALTEVRAGTGEEIYHERFMIAFAVTLASVMELVDTSIVNVAIPHMMGNLGATLEEIADAWRTVRAA